jgi:hypothetical protein
MPLKIGPKEKPPDDGHYVDELFYRLDEGEKIAIIRAGRLTDDRPSILRGRGGNRSDLSKWMKPIRHTIVPLLLRVVDLSDNAIGKLVSDGDLSLGDLFTARQVNLRFFLERAASHAPPHTFDAGAVRLTDLTGCSAVLFEMFVSICSANRPLGLQETFIPPDVRVEGGSVQFSLGGGMVASGIGLIVACSSGLLAPPAVVISSGIVLASIGLLDLVVGWKQKLAETRKTQEETRVLSVEHGTTALQHNRRLRELELRIGEMELEKARPIAQAESLEESRFAYSGLVPREVVVAEVNRWAGQKSTQIIS